MRKSSFFSALTFLTVFAFSNCKTPPPPKDFSKLDVLLGTWKVNNGSYYETWSKVNENRFYGRTFKIYAEADTFVMQSFDLVLQDGDIFYIPTIKTPKGDKAVSFKMTSDMENQFVFENPKNDYPKKVTYKMIDNKTAEVRIEDEKRKLDYNFVKED